MTKMNYDIFISCKSEDYPVARKVYQYLRDQKYSVFLADTELRKNGNAEYGEIIDEALDSTTHMVIVTPIRDKIAISCMLRQIHEFSSHAIRHGLYIKNRKRLFCP